MPVSVPPDEPVLADDQFGATEFNPCQVEPTRFAPLVVDGGCVPTLYGAEALDAVLMESVFHDVVLDRRDGEPPEVNLADLETVRRSTIAARRDRRLGRPDDDGLEALGLSRVDHHAYKADSDFVEGC